jgi:hypothetical protein
MIPVEVQKRLTLIAQQYGRQYLSQARSVLSQKKFKATGDLANSVKLQIIPGNAETSPQIKLVYDEVGEYIGSRRLIYTKQAPADAMLEYVRSPKFKQKSIPGYSAGSTPTISKEKQQERIAFAIARSKYKDQKHRRKKWKREFLPELLSSMNDKLVRAWAEESEKIIAASITTKTR